MDTPQEFPIRQGAQPPIRLSIPNRLLSPVKMTPFTHEDIDVFWKRKLAELDALCPYSPSD